MALNPAITAANGQTEPLRQAQLVLSGSVMSTAAVGLAPSSVWQSHQRSGQLPATMCSVHTCLNEL